MGVIPHRPGSTPAKVFRSGSGAPRLLGGPGREPRRRPRSSGSGRRQGPAAISVRARRRKRHQRASVPGAQALAVVCMRSDDRSRPTASGAPASGGVAPRPAVRCARRPGRRPLDIVQLRRERGYVAVRSSPGWQQLATMDPVERPNRRRARRGRAGGRDARREQRHSSGVLGPPYGPPCNRHPAALARLEAVGRALGSIAGGVCGRIRPRYGTAGAAQYPRRAEAAASPRPAPARRLSTRAVPPGLPREDPS